MMSISSVLYERIVWRCSPTLIHMASYSTLSSLLIRRSNISIPWMKNMSIYQDVNVVSIHRNRLHWTKSQRHYCQQHHRSSSTSGIIRKAWEGTKAMGKQIWSGTRQLYYNTCRAIMLRQQQDPLTREEIHFINRNHADLITCGPFLLYLCLPGSVYTIPIVLKVFPQFFPSTFTDESMKSKEFTVLTNTRKTVRPKLVSIFHRACNHLKSTDAVEDRTLGERLEYLCTNDDVSINSLNISKEDFIRLSDAFKESSICLRSLRRFEIRLLAQHMGVESGWRTYVALDRHMERLLKDDLLIISTGGVKELRDKELLEAVTERGLPYVSDMHTRRLILSQWISFVNTSPRPPHAVLIAYAVFVCRNPPTIRTDARNERQNTGRVA